MKKYTYQNRIYTPNSRTVPERYWLTVDELYNRVKWQYVARVTQDLASEGIGPHEGVPTAEYWWLLQKRNVKEWKRKIRRGLI